MSTALEQGLVPLFRAGAGERVAVDLRRRRAGGRRSGVPQRWFLTPAIRERILASYDSKNRRELAAEFNVPPHVVGKWAVQLGVARTKEPRWTAEDLALLEAKLPIWGWKRLAKALGRTVVAVKLRAKRLDLHKIVRSDFTPTYLSKALGVDVHKVLGWIAAGKLQATRRHTDRTSAQGGDAWRVTPLALRWFFRDHPGEIDLRRVDRAWFLEFAFGDRAPGRS